MGSAKIGLRGPSALKTGQNGPQRSVAQQAHDALDMISGSSRPR